MKKLEFEKLITGLLALGFREYKPTMIEQYDRAWQKGLYDKDKEPTKFINVNWYDFSKYPNAPRGGLNYPEIEFYEDMGKYAKSTKYYAFSNYKDILNLIQELL